jgi:hypothetical protein
LVKGNRIRTYRKELKLDIKHSRRDPLRTLLHPPEELATMKLFDYLMAMPKIGRTKANRLLTVCRISPSKTIGGLSERQRGEVASLLRR